MNSRNPLRNLLPLRGEGERRLLLHRAPATNGRRMLSVLLLSILTLVAATAHGESEQKVYGMQNGDNVPIGATGVKARLLKDGKAVVADIQSGTPAYGKLGKGDTILGINGAKLEGKDPFVAFGAALTEAEATNGNLTFEVKPGNGSEPKQVTFTIPVLGAYGKTFPLNCEKSKEIIRRAAEFYAAKDRLKGHNHLNAVACLFLLSTGDDKYVPRVKEYFAQFLKPGGEVTGLGDMTWDNGYNGVACAEYYLRTGDGSVLPILKYYCDDAQRRIKYNSGWSHWGNAPSFSYEAGGGLMNPAGNQVLLTLVLSKMCGVEVDEKTLVGSLRYFYRFIGHGICGIADQRAWASFGSVDRAGATAAVMHVACAAQGNTTIYKQAKDYLTMFVSTSWPGNLWDVIWYDLSATYRLESNADMYHQAKQRYRWAYDLYRQPSGSFYYPPGHDTLDSNNAGASVALALTAPLKALFITGAPRSKYAKDFTLPVHLWGTDADLAFFSPKHNKDFYKYGKDEEIFVPYSQLQLESKVRGNENLTKVALDVMLKNVRHARYEIRAQAALALCVNRRFGELEELLRDPDPRLRRAALDGINDYRPWFTDSPVRTRALKAGDYTPAMIEAITKIMNDPNESWYVVDGAMLALSHAPVDAIRKNVPRILPWTKQDDWWLRDSAFMALMGLREDEESFVQQLPVLIDMLGKEIHYNPHYRMMVQLSDALTKWKNDSRPGKLIAAGFTQAALKIDDQSQNDTAFSSAAKEANLVSSLQASLVGAPEDAANVAEALVNRGLLKTLTNKSLMAIVKGNDGHKADRFVGLQPALEKIADPQRKKLSDILYNVIRPEMATRFNNASDEKEFSGLLDLIAELSALKTKNAGWQPIGLPEPEERTWRFYSFGALPKKNEGGPQDPLRDAKLPTGAKNWASPEFDDTQWKSGRAPIGVGVFKAYGHGTGGTAEPDRTFKNNSEWGDGGYLMARTTFEMNDLDFDFYRLQILAAGRCVIYLNGHNILKSPGSGEMPLYSSILLDPKVASYLRKGPNTLAISCNINYAMDRQTQKYRYFGQLDLFLEGLKKKEIGLSLSSEPKVKNKEK